LFFEEVMTLITVSNAIFSDFSSIAFIVSCDSDDGDVNVGVSSFPCVLAINLEDFRRGCPITWAFVMACDGTSKEECLFSLLRSSISSFANFIFLV
jgi:hypothetical protein